MALLLVSALLALSLAKAKAGSYLVTAPNVIYRGSVYDISVDILNTTDVNLKVVMQSKTYNGTRRDYDIVPVNSVEGVFGKGHTGTLSIPVSTDLMCQGCQLHIRGSGGLQFERNLPVRLSDTVVAVMIQTDKAIYKPGTMVRYRAFAVYPDLRLYTGEFVVKIMDPNDNKIQVLTGLSSISGVIEGSLQLSEQPLFGDWSIAVSLEETSDTNVQRFTVADYQLPRFEITVELPPYGLTYQSELTGTVKAKYTFGKPVKGMVELHVGPHRGPDGCGSMPKTTQMSFEIDGEATFNMPKEDIQRSVRLSDNTQVQVTAFVKEAATGVRLNGSSVITYHRNKYDVKFLDNTPTVFKPGMPYTAFVQVSSPDGLPPTRRNQVISVYTYVDYRLSTPDQSLYGTSIFTGSYPLPGKNATLPANGVLAIDIDIPNNATSINIQVTYLRRSASKKIEKTYSKSGNFLQLTLLDKNIKARSTANFNVKGTEPLGKLTYEILSRGSLAYSGVINGEDRTSVDFSVSVTSAMAPTGHMLVYYARGSKEIVADSLAFNVDGIFENEVSIAFSRNKSEPHQEVDVIVKADPGSTVNLLAVDQSVLLLKTGNDITPKKVGDAVSTFDAGKKPSDSEYALSYSAKTVMEVFEQTGLAVITDVDMHRPPPPQMHYGPRGGYSYDSDIELEYRPMNRMPSATFTSSTPQLVAVERVRAIFPEAWLWSSASTSSDGQASIKTTVPDTITSWVASAFATNPVSGLGVAPTTAKLQVFRPFFVSLSYPNEVTRGEQVVIQATVFNYLPADAEVVVTLKPAPGLSNLEVAADGTETPTKGDITRTLLVKTQEQGVAYYSVSATKLGVVNIEVEAQSSQAADAVRRTILVKSEGAPVSFTDSVFIHNEKDSDVFQDTVLVSVPPVTVKDSVRAKVKVTGDLISTSLDGLTSLLSLPTGCGEQSMVKFAPDLYIAQYLQATGQLTDYLRQTIVSYLGAGYQRQLTYQRYDGSFSAFGNSDESGSTWLTAYVISAFSQARDFIYVDPDMIMKAVDWLVDRQNRDGSFSEFGSVLDRNIQNTETGPGLTAHVLVALMSSNDLTSPTSCKSGTRSDCSRHNRWTNATNNAISNLEHHVSSVEDQLSLAVLSYALSLAGSPQAATAVEKLNGFSKTEGALMYWSQNSTVTSPSTPVMDYRGSTYLPLWRPPHVQARPVDIQITSLAVLTYTAQGNLAEGLPAVRWLTAQRNSLGGFVSSQDTTLALQALSAYATKSIRPDSKLKVKVATELSEVITFDVGSENALVLQTEQFQEVPSQVDVTAKGAGLALVEIDFNFYVTEDLATPSFDVSTVLLDDEIDYFNLMVCTKWLWDRKTGMVVQEVSIPSGFEPEMDSLNDVAGMKRAERLGNRVTVYFDEITKTSTCYSVMMSRVAKVARTQSNYVRTYDYYEPANQATVFYQPKKLRDATICDVCDGCCQ